MVGELAPGARSVLLVQDDTPMRRAGADLKRGVAEGLRNAGSEVEVCELAGGADGSLHVEFESLDEVIEQLRPGGDRASAAER